MRNEERTDTQMNIFGFQKKMKTVTQMQSEHICWVRLLEIMTHLCLHNWNK